MAIVRMHSRRTGIVVSFVFVIISYYVDISNCAWRGEDASELMGDSDQGGLTMVKWNPLHGESRFYRSVPARLTDGNENEEIFWPADDSLTDVRQHRQKRQTLTSSGDHSGDHSGNDPCQENGSLCPGYGQVCEEADTEPGGYRCVCGDGFEPAPYVPYTGLTCSHIPESKKMYLTITLDYPYKRRLGRNDSSESILLTEEFKSNLDQVFKGVTGFKTLNVVEFRDDSGHTQAVLALSFTTDVLPGQLREVAEAVVRMEEAGLAFAALGTAARQLGLTGIYSSYAEVAVSSTDAVDWCSHRALNNCSKDRYCVDKGVDPRYGCLCLPGFRAPRTNEPCLADYMANINTRHDVTCGETEMSFDIALPADVTIPQKVTLSDPRCAVTGGPHRLQGQTALNACGTTVAFLNDSVVFSNEIFLNPDSNSTANGIVIPIHCHYNISYDLRLSYLPIVRQVLFTEEGVGQFGFQMQQFQDPQYSVAVDAASYPLRTIPSQEIYVQLSLRDLGLRTSVGRLAYGMDVERCLASPLASVTDARLREHEDLILEGCPASGKVHLHRHNTSASGSDYFRFSFHGVTFSSDPADPTRSFAGLVYVHCHVTLCPQGQCRADQQPCSPAGVGQRKKRAATWQSQAAGHQLSTGPLLVLAATEDLATSYNPAVIALSVVAAVACLAVVVVVVAWRRGVRPAKGGFQLVKVDEQE